jgi:diacylglycerol kinase (ATP)
MAPKTHLPDLKNEALDAIPRAFSQGGLSASFKAAGAGVARTLATQRNMKIHWLAGLMVILVATALPFDLTIKVALLFSVSLVLFAEILNTALEAFVDLHVQEYHRLAMLAKDAAAAGVLVLALGTVLIFTEMVYYQWDLVLAHQDAVWTTVLWGIPLIASEWVGLFLLRRNIVNGIRFLLSITLLIILFPISQDPIFSGLGFLWVTVAVIARHIYPHNAPTEHQNV